MVAPDVERLVVVHEYCHAEPVLIESELTPVRNSQVQGMTSALEVVAEAEVAEHLEEGAVGVIADAVDIACPEALLDGAHLRAWEAQPRR